MEGEEGGGKGEEIWGLPDAPGPPSISPEGWIGAGNNGKGTVRNSTQRGMTVGIEHSC